MVQSARKEDPHYAFWNPKADAEELFAAQGVKPITNVDDLYGDFWPEEEDIEDFLAAWREWRSEGSRGVS